MEPTTIQQGIKLKFYMLRIKSCRHVMSNLQVILLSFPIWRCANWIQQVPVVGEKANGWRRSFPWCNSETSDMGSLEWNCGWFQVISVGSPNKLRLLFVQHQDGWIYWYPLSSSVEHGASLQLEIIWTHAPGAVFLNSYDWSEKHSFTKHKVHFGSLPTCKNQFLWWAFPASVSVVSGLQRKSQTLM